MAKPNKVMTFTAAGYMEQKPEGGFVMNLDMAVSPPQLPEMTFTGAGSIEQKADGGFNMQLDAA
jgi:hypothetical protein